jgi:hypothetical protein
LSLPADTNSSSSLGLPLMANSTFPSIATFFFTKRRREILMAKYEIKRRDKLAGWSIQSKKFPSSLFGLFFHLLLASRAHSPSQPMKRRGNYFIHDSSLTILHFLASRPIHTFSLPNQNQKGRSPFSPQFLLAPPFSSHSLHIWPFLCWLGLAPDWKEKCNFPTEIRRAHGSSKKCKGMRNSSFDCITNLGSQIFLLR